MLQKTRSKKGVKPDGPSNSIGQWNCKARARRRTVNVHDADAGPQKKEGENQHEGKLKPDLCPRELAASKKPLRNRRMQGKGRKPHQQETKCPQTKYAAKKV